MVTIPCSDLLFSPPSPLSLLFFLKGKRDNGEIYRHHRHLSSPGQPARIGKIGTIVKNGTPQPLLGVSAIVTRPPALDARQAAAQSVGMGTTVDIAVGSASPVSALSTVIFEPCFDRSSFTWTPAFANGGASRRNSPESLFGAFGKPLLVATSPLTTLNNSECNVAVHCLT